MSGRFLNAVKTKINGETRTRSFAIHLAGHQVYALSENALCDTEAYDAFCLGLSVQQASDLLETFPPGDPLTDDGSRYSRATWDLYLQMRAAWRKAHGLEAEGDSDASR